MPQKIKSNGLAHSGRVESSSKLALAFDHIATCLHRLGGPARYDVIMKLLIIRIHEQHIGRRIFPSSIYEVVKGNHISDDRLVSRLNYALTGALERFGLRESTVPNLSPVFECEPMILRQAANLVARLEIRDSHTEILQQFYARFAATPHKEQLSQYFTPPKLVDFIVRLTSPKGGETILDPACGAADFLIAASRMAKESKAIGIDQSTLATQIALLNVKINGIRNVRISTQDSLEMSGSQKSCSLVYCNPPFGTRVLETREKVLARYELGKEAFIDNGAVMVSKRVRSRQQKGLLFVEHCIRRASANAKIAVIVPNGYLSNRGKEYLVLRHLVLRHCRMIAVVGFPRFALRSWGGDVSASVMVLQKRQKPLDRIADDDDYCFFVACVDSIGSRSDKRRTKIYKRDPVAGTPYIGEDGKPSIDSDFDDVVGAFEQWQRTGQTKQKLHRPFATQAHLTPIRTILETNDWTLDPKRYCAKVKLTRHAVQAARSFRLGDALEPIPPRDINIVDSAMYRYADVSSIGRAEFGYKELRGWQLPTRARLLATPGDIFICHVWASVGKWFIAPIDDGLAPLVVTTGCTALRIKTHADTLLVDLAVGLCSEAFRQQMRAFARGSDGLAEVTDEDLLAIVLPQITAPELRATVEQRLAPMRNGATRFATFAESIAQESNCPLVKARRHHSALV